MPYRRPTRKDWAQAVGRIVLLVGALGVIGAFLIPLAGDVVGGALFVIVGAVGLSALARWHARRTAYRCRACGHEFEISLAADFLSFHFWTTKYLRCPRCQKRSWATILVKE